MNIYELCNYADNVNYTVANKIGKMIDEKMKEYV